MRLEHLRLSNYRCFADLEVDLERDLTVVVAENGAGKSALLDAIRIGLWPFISGFDLARSSTYNDPANGIAIADVRVAPVADGSMARQLPARVTLTADWGDGEEPRSWSRYRESENSRTKTLDDAAAKRLRQWAGEIQTRIRDPRQPALSLPVFGYYGTGRLWAQKKLTEQNEERRDETADPEFDIRTFAYRNCMDPASTYKHFREWFIRAWKSRSNLAFMSAATDQERQQADARIRAVQCAIDTFLQRATGWHTLELQETTAGSHLILNHPEQGRLSVDQLSDGIRSMLALTGDIAHRCVKLNRHLGAEAARETAGVVLIDEIDMHLHPRWQQTVITQLRGAFPRIQFVVTTHSPQVLSTVDSRCIRILASGNVHAAPPGTRGAEASRILRRVQGVEVRPPDDENTRLLNAYLDLVYHDQWTTDEARAQRRHQTERPLAGDACMDAGGRRGPLCSSSDATPKAGSPLSRG